MLAYKCMAGIPGNQDDLKIEFKEAEAFQEIRLGASHLFYRPFLRVKYVDYHVIKNAFLRMESGESGDFPTNTTYLVLVDEEFKEISFTMERVDTAKKMLARLEELHPEILYGYTK